MGRSQGRSIISRSTSIPGGASRAPKALTPGRVLADPSCSSASLRGGIPCHPASRRRFSLTVPAFGRIYPARYPRKKALHASPGGKDCVRMRPHRARGFCSACLPLQLSPFHSTRRGPKRSIRTPFMICRHWFELKDFQTSFLGRGEQLDISLPLGAHSIRLIVTDRHGETDSQDFTLSILDTTPPTLSSGVSSSILWPPKSSARPDSCHRECVGQLRCRHDGSGIDPQQRARQ